MSHHFHYRSFCLSFLASLAIIQGLIRSFMGFGMDYHLFLPSSNNATTTTPTERDPYLPRQDILLQPKSWEIMPDVDKRSLNFVHIPKTGGTSLVMAAAAAGYAWSDCLFPLRRERKNCPDHPLNYFNDTTLRQQHYLFEPEQWKKPHPFLGSWWHVPIQYLPNSKKNPYQDQDLFVVIRNPYQRVVSQYYYRCLRDKRADCYLLGNNNISSNNNRTKNGNSNNNNKHTIINDTPQQMNAVIQDMIRKQKKSLLGSRDYFFHDGHWIPQAHYVYNVTRRNSESNNHNERNVTTANNNNNNNLTPPPSYPRLVQHVLHFEYLQEQFASLMRAYHFENIITLPEKKMLDRAEFRTNATVEDLTQESLLLIEEVYHDDFVLGGYPILSQQPKLQQQQPIEMENQDNTDGGGDGDGKLRL